MEWFLELNQSRSAGFGGPGALSYREIESWAKLTRRKLALWEVRALKKIDMVYLSIHYE